MKLKSFWKTKGFKSWFFTTLPLTALALTTGAVLTANDLIYETLVQVFGGERRKAISGDPSKYQYYTTEYESKDDVYEAANALNEEIVSEGITLLKNENNSLPLEKQSKVTVFGKNSTDLVLSGSGSNSGSSGDEETKTIYDSLENAGFSFNPVMKDFYENDSRSGSGRPASPDMNSTITGLTGFPTGETPVSSYGEDVKESFDDYNDAAIVVFSRIGGEGFDLPRSMFWDGRSYQNWSGEETIPGARNKDDHYLQLDQNETDMLKLACENFDNVIVVINSATPMELGFLDDPTHYAYSDKITSALWLSAPGNTGVMALGKILNGDVNPSGRLVDIYARNFKEDPTWNNFSNNLSEGGNQYMDEEGKARNAYFVNYSEGIYIGYRYYETRGETDGEEWYDKNVIYPFGYGLSYTDFSYEVKDVTGTEDITGDSTIQIQVDVTNTGDVAGKDVVQLYYSAPYVAGEIEKSHVVLGDFAKTPLIQPKETASVTLTLDARDMAGYDYNDANGNDFVGYELEEGTYDFYVARNSHDRSNKISKKLTSDVRYETDERTGKEIENLFDDASARIETYLSRSDWDKTWPQVPDTATRTLSSADMKHLATYKVNDSESDPWFAYDAPNQSPIELTYEETEVKLWNLIGKDYDDPLWDTLLDQLTVDQMAHLVAVGNYHTEAIENIDKPLTTDPDGPMGYSIFMGNPSVYKTCHYACESLAGATFNVELLERFGDMIGNESIIGNEKGDGVPYSGWYAPACNLHRSPFGGRNFEYYSEDPVLSAKLATAVIQGASKKGVYTYLKHFALNEQETNRDTNGLIVWANEQSMREMYFLPFEEAVKTGGTRAMMSSFTRIGFTWCGGHYSLLTTLLREEWGFRGMVVTDYNLQPYMNLDQMVRAGGDVNLSQTKSIGDTESATAQAAIRRATKNILYTVCNSNAMNGFGEGVRYAYARPTWFVIMWSVVGVLLAGLAVWGVFVFLRVRKLDKAARSQNAYPDGTPYSVEKVKKIKTYHFTIPSIIYGSVALATLLGATGVSIYYLTTPDRLDPVSEVADPHLSTITLLLNHKPIAENTIQLNVGENGNYINVQIDTYGLSSGGYTIASSNTEVLEIDENGQLLPKMKGESIITAKAKADESLATSVLVKVVDNSTPVEKESHSITVIGGYADVQEAKEGELVTLTVTPEDYASFSSWQFDVENIWQNGNTFRMPDCDVTVTAIFDYDDFTVTLENATIDGKSSITLPAFSTIENIVPGKPQHEYETEEVLGYRDTEGNLYTLPFTVPTKDITISPFFRIDGPNHTLATGTRNYAGGDVTAEKTTWEGITSTTYTLPAGKTDDSFDIMNLANSTDGFLIHDGDIRNLVYIFQNTGDEAIDFTYGVEFGSANVQLAPHSYKVVEFQAIGDTEVRPYHHVTLNADLNTGTSLKVTAFEYDVYNVTLEGGLTFADGTTSAKVRAGEKIPEVDLSKLPTDELKSYEKWAVGEEGNPIDTMPYRNVTLSAQKAVDGTGFPLATKTRRYAAGAIAAKKVSFSGTTATTYTILPGKTGDYFDIQNEKTSTDGFFLKAGESANVLLRFRNAGESTIAFTFDMELGTVDCEVLPGKTKDYVVPVKNDAKDATDLRPYFHLHLTKDLASTVDLTVAGFLLHAAEN